MKTQDEMRSEFEKLPEVAAELENSDGELYWCDKQNQYRNNRVFQDSQTGWMNGAWYAFQEQQKKIDEALKHVVDHGGYDDLTHVINILK